MGLDGGASADEGLLRLLQLLVLRKRRGCGIFSLALGGCSLGYRAVFGVGGIGYIGLFPDFRICGVEFSGFRDNLFGFYVVFYRLFEGSLSGRPGLQQ